MTNSILTNTKKVLGIDADYTAFDLDITMHINSVFATLNQLGVGPADGFFIIDDTLTWQDFTNYLPLLNSVKTYMYLKVRLIFDPPATSFTQDSMAKIAQEFEWRLMIAAESAAVSINGTSLDDVKTEVDELEEEIDKVPDLKQQFENNLR